MYYINIFFIFSLIGHVLENFVYTKVDSGILYGIWTPIYGLGVLTIIFINKYLNKFKLNKWLKPVLLFVICSIVLAIIETIGGYFIEMVYGRVFWSYRHHFMPIGKYTSIHMMMLWGIASVGLIYLFMPYVEGIIRKIPRWITYILIVLFVVDLIYTFMKLADLMFTLI